VSAVLDHPAVRLNAESVGRARDFIRRVYRDDVAFLNLINELLTPVKARHARHPGRKLRPEMVAIIAHSWRTKGPAEFRVAYNADIDGAKGSIVERRLGKARIEMVNDPDWTGFEDGVSVMELRFVAGAHGASSSNVLLANFSMHSLARWYQRRIGHATDRDLINDMNVVANVDLSTLRRGGGGLKITTDATNGGGWRGRLMVIEDCDGERHRLLAVRTWLES
jgi:hypothetical protein